MDNIQPPSILCVHGFANLGQVLVKQSVLRTLFNAIEQASSLVELARHSLRYRILNWFYSLRYSARTAQD